MSKTLRLSRRFKESEVLDHVPLKEFDRRWQIRSKDEERVARSEREGQRSELQSIPPSVQRRIDSIGNVGFKQALDLVRSSRAGRRPQLESLKKLHGEGQANTREIIERELEAVGVDIAKWKTGKPTHKDPELLHIKEKVLKELLDAGARPFVVPELIGVCAMTYGTEPYEYQRRADGSVMTDRSGKPLADYVLDAGGRRVREGFGRDKPRRTEFLRFINASINLPDDLVKGSLKSYADAICGNCITDIHRLLLENPGHGPWNTADIVSELDYYRRFKKNPAEKTERQYVMEMVAKSCNVLEWMGLVEKYPQDTTLGAGVSNRYIHSGHITSHGGIPNDNVDFWLLKTLYTKGPQPTSRLYSRQDRKKEATDFPTPFNEGAVSLGLNRLETDGLIRIEGIGKKVAHLTEAGRKAMKGQEAAESVAAELKIPPFLDRRLSKLILGEYREGFDAKELRRYGQIVKAITLGRMLEEGVDKPTIMFTVNPGLDRRGRSHDKQYGDLHAYIGQIESGRYPWDTILPEKRKDVFLPALAQAEAEGLIPKGHTQWYVEHALDKK